MKQVFQFTMLNGAVREYDVEVDGLKFRFADSNTTSRNFPFYISDFLGATGKVK